MMEHKQDIPEPAQSWGPGTWKQAVYTCMPGGTSSGMPGLPDTVTWWERQLPLEGSLCARIYIALQGGEVGRDSNQHQIQHELTPKSLE